MPGATRQLDCPAPQENLSVPYVDLARQHAPLRNELLDAVGQVLDDGQFILGERVVQFEQAFAQLCGTRFAIAVNSGTDALILALRALGIGAGDEVITVPNSFVATTSAISLVGATPVFVDVSDDFNLDPARLEPAITRRTKAILPVHLTGRPANMAAIQNVADARGLPVIEDASQAVLAEYRGRRVGSFGTLGCFSLHPLKTLGACGDAGVITTNDADLDRELRLLRNVGLVSRDNSVIWSSHSRLDTLQASILLLKLKYVEAWTEKRRANAASYQHALSEISDVVVPIDRPHEKAVYHTFVIQVDDRDELAANLSERGIQTAIHYPRPVHLQSAARELGYRRGSFPIAERQADRILSLPIHSELEHDQLDHVVTTIRRFYSDSFQARTVFLS